MRIRRTLPKSEPDQRITTRATITVEVEIAGPLLEVNTLLAGMDYAWADGPTGWVFRAMRSAPSLHVTDATLDALRVSGVKTRRGAGDVAVSVEGPGTWAELVRE